MYVCRIHEIKHSVWYAFEILTAMQINVRLFNPMKANEMCRRTANAPLNENTQREKKICARSEFAIFSIAQSFHDS